MEEGDKEQTISPMSIMIECIGNLYKAMHNLGPFASRIKLGRAMQTRVNLFISNKEWVTSHILNFKIEGPIEQQHPIKMEIPMSVRANTPISDTSNSNHRLVGRDATPGPTPELSMITNHHLKVLVTESAQKVLRRKNLGTGIGCQRSDQASCARNSQD
ncbi:uncharacterized protein UHOD_11330 [Ustilago sp. UG-2017b]|nr:uncharacterized protein UHOD_11330 [Ustilago sp. UG-2017b]